MDGAALRRTYIVLIVSVWIPVVSGRALGNNIINCGAPSHFIYLGMVDEGYTGDVEVVSGIPPGTVLTLEQDLYPEHLQFVELNTAGENTVTVRTKKPLDAEANIFFTPDNILGYSLVCNNNLTNKYSRRLVIKDINDNSPVFEKKFYSKNISESLALNTEVLRVTAVDADSSYQFSSLTYTYTPETPDFSLTNSGAFILTRPLNYSVVPKYNFVVTARDIDGKNDTTSVEIDVDCQEKWSFDDFAETFVTTEDEESASSHPSIPDEPLLHSRE